MVRENSLKMLKASNWWNGITTKPAGFGGSFHKIWWRYQLQWQIRKSTMLWQLELNILSLLDSIASFTLMDI